MNDARRKAPPCPVCGQPASEEVAPFCSTRCADVDLGRWLNERYVILGEDADDDGILLPREPEDSRPDRL